MGSDQKTMRVDFNDSPMEKSTELSTHELKTYSDDNNSKHVDKYMDKEKTITHDIQRTSSLTSDESEPTDLPTSSSKPALLETVERILHEGCSTNEHPRSWRPKFIRFGPLSGIFCMFLAVSSLIASLGILAGSDKQSVEHWSAPPSTYLAIFTAIANLSIRYAAIQGVLIAWWTRAMKGSNLTELHWRWYSGTTIRGAIAAGRRMGLVGIACIFSILVVMDGPLLQRASTTGPYTTVTDSLTLNVQMVPLIPHGFSGYWAKTEQLGLGRDVSVPIFNRTIPTIHGDVPNDVWPQVKTELGWDVIPALVDQKPLGGVIQGCANTCKATLRAPALFPTCISHQIPYDAWSSFDTAAVLASVAAPPYSHQSFMSWPSLSLDGDERIEIVTGYAHSKDCRGVLNYTLCTARSGIGEYEVVVKNDKIQMDTINTPKLIALANNTAVNYTRAPTKLPMQPSTLGGIVQVLETQYAGLVFFFPQGNTVSGIALDDQFDLLYQENAHSLCGDYGDPLPDLLDAMHRLMLYVGAAAAQKDRSNLQLDEELLDQVNTTTVADEYAEHYVFRTHYWFFAAAAIVDIVCIALVIPTYYGWWNLGRPVSFSPLEMAKAFESPLLTQFNSNSSARDIVGMTNGSGIKYGVLTQEGEGVQRGGRRLAFGGSNVATQPENGMKFAT